MIRALYYPDTHAAAFEANRHPGSFMLVPRNAPDLFEFNYFCPCGCGVQGSLLIGNDHKPEGTRASWRWNGSLTEPTLDPSVHHVGHWHGWLRNGYWALA